MTAPRDLIAAFRAYEGALMADDVETMSRLFAPGPDTLRGDADGLLVGHDRISAFRNARGGAPARRIVGTEVRMLDEIHAVIVAETLLDRGGRGLQTQVWRRDDTAGWQIITAHVGVPAPALDTRVWRVVGDPLVPGAEVGPLAGETIAVKDLIAVAGQRVGAGNPAHLAGAEPETAHGAVVAMLLEAGADVRGIARTDEFAYSLAGANAHYGTPPNPRAPYRLPGGSTSGPASAVALGHATVGLGTDTGGSIRVPAAYQGLYGVRTTHGAVSTDGVLPLAPTFDTVGWLARTPHLLAAVGDVLLPPAALPAKQATMVVVPELLELADTEVAAAVTSWLPEDRIVEHWHLTELDDWLAAFQLWQAWEAWQSHGRRLTDRFETLGPAIRARFVRAATVSTQDAQAALRTVERASTQIRELVDERVLVLPSAASTAPYPEDAEASRDATMRLTCLAGLGGLPAVSVPVTTGSGLPAGVCMVAGRGRDRDLLDLAVGLAGGSRASAHTGEH